jgi:Family of unknown function (DUF5682)
MSSLPALARVSRYGNVRESDSAQVAAIVHGLVTRIVVGLPMACSALDDDGAESLGVDIDAVHAALNLLEQPSLRDPWLVALAQVAARNDLHGLVAGRCSRILHDAGAIEPAELERRVRFVLSPGNDADNAAAWIEGFLGNSGLVLLHELQLLMVLDTWLSSVGAEAFTRLAPVLRRTFGKFAPAERRQIGEQVKQMTNAGAGHPLGVGAARSEEEQLDLRRAEFVLPVLRAILLGHAPDAASEHESHAVWPIEP